MLLWGDAEDTVWFRWGQECSTVHKSHEPQLLVAFWQAYSIHPAHTQGQRQTCTRSPKSHNHDQSIFVTMGLSGSRLSQHAGSAMLFSRLQLLFTLLMTSHKCKDSFNSTRAAFLPVAPVHGAHGYASRDLCVCGAGNIMLTPTPP